MLNSQQHLATIANLYRKCFICIGIAPLTHHLIWRTTLDNVLSGALIENRVVYRVCCTRSYKHPHTHSASLQAKTGVRLQFVCACTTLGMYCICMIQHTSPSQVAISDVRAIILTSQMLGILMYRRLFSPAKCLAFWCTGDYSHQPKAWHSDVRAIILTSQRLGILMYGRLFSPAKGLAFWCTGDYSHQPKAWHSDVRAITLTSQRLGIPGECDGQNFHETDESIWQHILQPRPTTERLLGTAIMEHR